MLDADDQFHEGHLDLFAATGQYTIQYFSVDLAGNVEPVETASTVIRVDKTLPTNSFSLASASGAFWSGSRLFYKSNAAGSFTLTNTVTDADSGALSATFPAIATTGWTHNAETVNSPAGGPFTSSLYLVDGGRGRPGHGRTNVHEQRRRRQYVGSTALTFAGRHHRSDGRRPQRERRRQASAVGSTSSTLAATWFRSPAPTTSRPRRPAPPAWRPRCSPSSRRSLANAGLRQAPGSGGPVRDAHDRHRNSATSPTWTPGSCYVFTLTGGKPIRSATPCEHQHPRSLCRCSWRHQRPITSAANGGPTVGKPEAGDTIEASPSTPRSTSEHRCPGDGVDHVLCNNVAGCSASTHTLITINGLSSTTGFDISNAFEASGFTQTVAGTFTLSADHLTVTFTITGTPDANAKKVTTTAKIVFVPNPALADLAGDAAAGSYTMPTAITWF